MEGDDQARPALRPLYPAHVNVTVAAALGAAPRRLSSLKDNIKNAAAPGARHDPQGSRHGQGDQAQPGMKERIERERALGGGWRGRKTCYVGTRG